MQKNPVPVDFPSEQFILQTGLYIWKLINFITFTDILLLPNGFSFFCFKYLELSSSDLVIAPGQPIKSN